MLKVFLGRDDMMRYWRPTPEIDRFAQLTKYTCTSHDSSSTIYTVLPRSVHKPSSLKAHNRVKQDYLEKEYTLMASQPFDIKTSWFLSLEVEMLRLGNQSENAETTNNGAYCGARQEKTPGFADYSLVAERLP